MAVIEDVFDELETPRCPTHPLTRLVVEGQHPDGGDARWMCPVPGCRTVRIA